VPNCRDAEEVVDKAPEVCSLAAQQVRGARTYWWSWRQGCGGVEVGAGPSRPCHLQALHAGDPGPWMVDMLAPPLPFPLPRAFLYLDLRRPDTIISSESSCLSSSSSSSACSPPPPASTTAHGRRRPRRHAVHPPPAAAPFPALPNHYRPHPCHRPCPPEVLTAHTPPPPSGLPPPPSIPLHPPVMEVSPPPEPR
jgi:hypothetical protein